MIYKKDKAIIVFSRLPVEGEVKTRLSKEIGNRYATEFYRICAEHLFSEVSKLKKDDIDLFLFYSDVNKTDNVKKWVGNEFYFCSQISGNLGKKMQHAFRYVFDKDYSKVIIVGTDIPDINSGLLINAFNNLDKYDFVIGPSDDGGFYLLGMKSLQGDLFIETEWGSETVFSDTLKSLKSKNASIKTLRKMIDVDTKKDLMRWYRDTKNDSNHPVKVFVESRREFYSLIKGE